MDIQLLSDAEAIIIRAAINILHDTARDAWQAHLAADNDLSKAKVSALGTYQGLCEAAASTLQAALIHAEVHHYCATAAEVVTQPHLRPA